MPSIVIRNDTGTPLPIASATTIFSKDDGIYVVLEDSTEIGPLGQGITGAPASGDLTGAYPSPTIAKLQGYAVDLTMAPAAGQVLTWDGTKWKAAPGGGGGGSQTLAQVISTGTPANDVNVPAAAPVIFRDGGSGSGVDLFSLVRTVSGSGSGLNVSMGPSTTGPGVFVNATGSGGVIQFQAQGNDVLTIDSLGAVSINGWTDGSLGSDIRITGGPGDSANGGGLSLRGGDSVDGNGGAILISGGSSDNADGGGLNISGGDGNLNGGDLTLASGDGTTPGRINLSSFRSVTQGEAVTLNQSGTAVGLFSGTVVPSAGGGVVANRGSLFFKGGVSGGTLYVKTGASNTSWTQVTLGILTLQGAYDGGSTITTTGVDGGNAVKIFQGTTANTENTALLVQLANPAVSPLSGTQGLATFDFSPSALSFGHAVVMRGAKMKDSLLYLSKDSGDTSLNVDPKTGLTWGTVNTTSITISAGRPTSVDSDGSQMVIQAGQGNNNANGGMLVVAGGDTDTPGTSGTGGALILSAGRAAGAGQTGGDASIDGGSGPSFPGNVSDAGNVLVGTLTSKAIFSGGIPNLPTWTHRGKMVVTGATEGREVLGEINTPGRLEVYDNGTDPAATGRPILYAKDFGGVKQFYVQPGSGSPFPIQPNSSPVIWRWNETDASQFTICKDDIASGGCVVSKVTGLEGPRLRVAFPTKATGLLMTSIMINDLTLPIYDTDAKRYILRFRLVGIADFTHYTEWYSAGASFLGNKLTGASHYSLSSMTQIGGFTRFAYIAGGTTSLSGGTPSWPTFDLNLGIGDDRSLSALFEYETTARKTAGSPPKFRGNFKLDVPAATTSRNADMMSDKTFAASVGAFGAGWNGATLDSCGLAFLGNTGTTANYYFEFDSLEVIKHPMDW